MNVKAAEVAGLVIFELGELTFGIRLTAVREILRMVAVTPVPEAPPWLLGVMNLRGLHVPVVDLRSRLGLEAPSPDAGHRIMVVDAGGGTAGLVVDEVEAVTTEEPDAVEPVKTLEDAGGAAHPVVGVARLGNLTVVLLDADRVAAGASSFNVSEGFDVLV